ncbi:tetratricopeptide repeat protein [Humisphaera borealis]|uniref:Tetratricopeptide repeat protein n=1 Tax=Humisphaera borealis TaxID=2807512 RepID=A0A7M2X1I6_9BACT|nr:tetratricopeptide repeat protein [Humisphaera borealis]QOV91312.1 tetratricopeptide repeat protein [Humisphaera borealis]
MTHRLPIFAKFILATFTVASAAGLLTGCGGAAPSGRQAGSASAEELRQRQAPRDDFEAGKEVPINADTHFAAGQFAEGQGNLPMAMDQYAKALKLDPRHKDSLYRTGIVQVKQRQFNSAIETFSKYVEASKGEATAYANLGFAYELAGRTTEAENTYRKGIQREPTNAACRVNYGLMLARKERFNEAILQMQTVLGEGEVHYNLASVYESMGRKEQAKIEYKKAIELAPNLRDAQARLDAMH